jgi:hypothetical protein
MKIALRVLLLLGGFLFLTSHLQAQQPNATIDEVKKQISKLEAVENDPETPDEIRNLNRKFLSERKAELATLLRKRIVALRTYQATVSTALKPEEQELLQASLRELEQDLQALGAKANIASASPTAGPQSRPPLSTNPQGERLEGLSGTGKAPVAQREPVALRMSILNDETQTPTLNTASILSPSALPQQQQQQQIPDPKAKKPTVEVNVASEQFSGDEVRGPATISLRNVNVLRYDVKVGREVTFPPGPDLTLPFIPPIPNEPAKNNPGADAGAKSQSGGQTLAGVAADLNDIEREKYSEVNLKITQAINASNAAKDNLESLVSASDSILTTGHGPEAIVESINDNLRPRIREALTKQWPDEKIEDLLGRLDVLKNRLINLPQNEKTSDPTAYETDLARIGELQTQLTGLKSSGQQGNAFRESQNKLRLWLPIIEGLRTSSFSLTAKVGCSFAFDRNKRTKVSLVKRDRMAPAGGTPSTEEIVTVVCSSPLSVSGGFGFSGLDERQIVFVQSTKDVTTNGVTAPVVINRFGFTNRSSFRTLPVLLLNTRFWEPNDTFALHISAGAAVDVKTGEGGTDLEFVVGPSISFMRSLFITPGLHIGRVPRLTGGFEIGQEVPAGVSTPPLEKFWQKGFVTTFTYKIR